MKNYLKLLLVALFVSFLSNYSHSVFISIDCGTSDSYKDEHSIVWSGDDGYIQNGESKVVYYTSFVPYAMTTLRVFTTRKKNCYSVKVDEIGERVLVRASFYYGNYDGKSSPPVFDLQFDGNYWATVNTSNFEVVSHEAIYVVKGNSTSICVAQTLPDQLPFISAIEVRSLGSKMYSDVDTNYALRLIKRASFGANDTIRYPFDAYDRIWSGAYGFGLTEVTNNAVTIKITAPDNPPLAVLKNAVTTISTSSGIELITGLPLKPAPIYIATYFSEVILLNSTAQKRSFQLYIDNKVASDPIIPPFGGVSEVYITDKIASSSTSFSLQATTDSTLPVLINAMEIYTLTDQLANGTNVIDVEGLGLLQSRFEILQGWSGDPCLPSSYTWDWVECSTSDVMPRVISLNLTGFGLFGSLPDFSSMDALETIEMSNNSLSGSIPDFLGSFRNLRLLNLANNRFNGSIPSSLAKNKKLKLVITGNCFSETYCEINEPSANTGVSPKNQVPTPMQNETPITDPFQRQTPFANSGGSKTTSKKLATTVFGVIIQLNFVYYFLFFKIF